MEPKQLLLLKKYADILLRKKIIISFCVVIAIIGGVGKYLTTSKVYKAETLLLYQKQSVNPAKLSPDIKEHTAQIVATLTEQVTSRTNLEDLIKKHNLYTGLLQLQPMEDVVAAMRERHISIAPDKRGDVFRVEFQSPDPKTAAAVANALAAKFVEENLRFREERATETSTYTEDELSMAKERLDKKEQLMRDYKLKYFNELPDQQTNNMARLNALQTQYQENQKSIYESEQTKVLLQEQLSVRARARTETGSELPLSATSPESTRQAELQRLRDSLVALQTKYTDKHPEVARLQKLIQQMEETPEPAAEKGGGRIGAATLPPGFRTEELSVQLREMDGSIAMLKQERDLIRQEIEKYSKWIEAAPIREAEWTALTRDHAQLRRNYEDLVARSLDAKAAENLERRQKGSQFKIIDSARTPEKPFKPDFKKIMLMAIAVGLVIGGLLSFGIELADTSFREASDVESDIGLPVVCSIPFVHTASERKTKNRKSLLWGSCFLVLFLCIAAGLFFLLRKGLIIL